MWWCTCCGVEGWGFVAFRKGRGLRTTDHVFTNAMHLLGT